MGVYNNESIPLQGSESGRLNSFNSQSWIDSEKSENNFNPNDIGAIHRLTELNKKLDEELSKIQPAANSYSFPKFLQISQSEKTGSLNFPKINGIELTGKVGRVNFTSADSQSPLCIRREGMLKIRDVDQKDKDVVVTYAVLTKDRLSYFVNAKDESSIQGSIELGRIKESLKLINGFPTCFTIKTIDGVSDCSVCAESEDSAREWINAVTQNAVNCNTMSSLSNLNKRGLLK